MGDRPFGILAGSGRLPEIVVDELRSRGREVVACYLTLEPSDRLVGSVTEGKVFSPENFETIPEYLANKNVEELVMVGSLDRSLLFDDQRLEEADQLVSERIEGPSTNADESLLRTALEVLESFDMTVLGLDRVLGEKLTPPGHLGGPVPESDQKKTLEHLAEIGPFLADHEVGQSLLGKRQSVVAVEAAEGTNKTIRRAGRLAGTGVVMLKLARSNQDFRLDVPVVGKSTLTELARIDADLLAVEVGKTLWVEREECLEIAGDAEISLFGWERSG